MGKKVKLNINIKTYLKIVIFRHPLLRKGSNVGFDNIELKSTSTKELRNILKSIYIYFTFNTRQKSQNLNFKNLFYRIKNELIYRKNIIKFKGLVPIPLNELNIPSFLNDKEKIKTPKSESGTNECSTTDDVIYNNIDNNNFNNDNNIFNNNNNMNNLNEINNYNNNLNYNNFIKNDININYNNNNNNINNSNIINNNMNKCKILMENKNIDNSKQDNYLNSIDEINNQIHESFYLKNNYNYKYNYNNNYNSQIENNYNYFYNELKYDEFYSNFENLL